VCGQAWKLFSSSLFLTVPFLPPQISAVLYSTRLSRDTPVTPATSWARATEEGIAEGDIELRAELG
jgi:hypothetical protein